MTDTTITDATRAEMGRWASIADGARARVGGAKFGVILATYDAETGSIATAADVKSTGLLPKSTAERYAQWAAAVAQALGFAPEPNAANADKLAVFVSLAGAAANVPAAHRNGIIERLAAHADSLADLVKRAESLLEEAKEAREPQARGARPEGNKPAETVTDEPANEPVATAEKPTVTLADALAVVSAHLQAHPDDVDTLDALQSMIDAAWQVVLA